MAGRATGPEVPIRHLAIDTGETRLILLSEISPLPGFGRPSTSPKIARLLKRLEGSSAASNATPLLVVVDRGPRD